MTLRVFDGWTPTETHEHRDADGNLTGTTTITREPEFDDRLRAEYLAAVTYDDMCCASCRNFDTVVEIPAGRRHVTFDEHGGRVIDVHQYLCLACASSQFVERLFTEANRQRKADPGQVAPSDGKVFVASPLSLEG